VVEIKAISLSEAEANFHALMREISSGYEYTITQGEKKEALAVIIPYEKWQKTKKRQLGILQSKGAVVFEPDFKMTDEELTNI
jgi:antitoxin (DNA-binding transcriptional repressor) of toxin-antitoxin stability system